MAVRPLVCFDFLATLLFWKFAETFHVFLVHVGNQGRRRKHETNILETISPVYFVTHKLVRIPLSFELPLHPFPWSCENVRPENGPKSTWRMPKRQLRGLSDLVIRTIWCVKNRPWNLHGRLWNLVRISGVHNVKSMCKKIFLDVFRLQIGRNFWHLLRFLLTPMTNSLCITLSKVQIIWWHRWSMRRWPPERPW